MPSEREVPAHTVKALRPKHHAYCVTVIVMNEGGRIRRQLRRMRPFSDLVDIILVDGGSSDNSLDEDILLENHVRSLLVTTETGLCTATRLGIHYAVTEQYKGLITMDGNGKDGVEAIPRFVEKLAAGYDLVQGSRFLSGGFHEHTPWDRLAGIRLVVAPLLSFYSGFRYTDPTNAFRALSLRYLKSKKLCPMRELFVRFNLQFYLLYQAPLLEFRVCEIPVQRSYPANGQVPTKIHGIGTKLLLIKELLYTVAGRYDPPARNTSRQTAEQINPKHAALTNKN